MSDTLTPREMIELSIAIEANGQALYADLERAAQVEAVRRMWGFLKDQEREHQALFQQMADDLAGYTVAEFGNDDFHAYIQALAGMSIFTEKSRARAKAADFPTEIAAIDYALTAEKDSILLYTALKLTLNPKGQKIIDRIIHEEQRHFTGLTELRRACAAREH